MDRLLLVALVALLAAGCPSEDGPVAREAWEPAFDATSTGWLMNVWGPSAGSLVAVGGEPERGRVMRLESERWDVLDTGLETPLLNWGFGFGDDELFLVGNGGTVLHRRGGRFEREATPTTEDLWGVWGAGPDDVWAVGGRGRQEGQATILHYDGSRWSVQELPALERPRVWAFFKVWGSAADDVWVVGQRGVVLRYDGNTWTEHLVGASDDLIAVWGTDRSHVVAVGGRGNGIVSTYDGMRWTTRSLSPIGGLNGVWTRDGEHVHAVGNDGTIVVLDFATGSVLAEDLQPTRLAIHSIFGVDGRLTAVGGTLAFPDGPYEGLALTRALGEDE